MPDTFHNLLVHVVFSAKYRDPIIRDDFKEEFIELLEKHGIYYDPMYLE